MKKLFGLGLIFLTILTTGCSSDDSNDENSTVSATINGAAWKPTKKVGATLIKIPGQGQRFDISIHSNSEILSLAFESELTTNNAMPLGTYNFYEDPEEGQISNALFFNSYLIDGDTYTEHFPVLGKITVTAIDPVKKTISGTFSFRAQKEGVLQTKIVTPEVFEVTNGVFENLSYLVFTATP